LRLPLDPGSIPEKKPYRRLKLFASGELNRLILGALRKAEKPLTTGEITAAVVNELGHGPEARKGIANRVRANLNYLVRERGACGQGRGSLRREVASQPQFEPIADSSTLSTAVQSGKIEHGYYDGPCNRCRRGVM
jgi:hypothetical protein